mmetsp:Transcript_107/g.251  ORF Transcript_107/g.251 Transcript_107/m.251 type:complete len:914 (-) Transcript_107:187-2928(-)
MVAATAPRRGLAGYTSFPRTGPPRSYSHESTHSSPPSSPWFACNAKKNMTPDETNNVPHHHHHPHHHHPNQPLPSPGMITVHHNTRQQESSRQHQQQRQSPRYSNQQQQQRQPNYPATIEFTPSQDHPDHHINNFNEANFNMSMNEVSLEDTFGFAANSKNDDAFERLYTGNDDEDNTFQSSIDLNPYTAKEFGANLSTSTKQKKQNNQKLPQNNTMNITKRIAQPQAASKPIQREGDSIFRTPSHEPPQIPPPPHTSSYEKKINENMQMISPTVAMDRRRKKAQDQAQPNIMSPNSSFFTSASPAVPGPVKSVKSGPLQCGTLQCGAPSIQRANTATSILRNHTATSSSSILRRNNTGTTASSSRSSRNRSTSRSRRSRSRGTSISRSGGGGGRRRSRSRSTSIAAHPKKEDDYHQNLFRGAKMIREQLLRSMASADQAMDEAEREFMEEMIERGGKTGGGDRQQRKKVQEKDDSFDNGDIDFDYSFDHGKAGDVKTGVVPSPPRVDGIKPSASQDSSALETESRRLDNLMSIFVANSSASSSNVGLGTKGSSSDKENGLQARTTFGEVNTPNIISPSSTLGMDSPMSQLMSPTQQAKAYNEYASQYFQEDAPKPSPASRYFQEDVPKPIVTSPSVDSARTSAKNSISIARSDHAHKQHTHTKYQAHKESPQKYQEEEVDEAMAHAQRAGPLWRSLVGNHVRFPSRWDSLLPSTSPPIHSLNQKWSKWYYIARHRVKGDKRLNSREFGVRSRRTGGRVLMKLVVREMHSQQVCREIAIGCFHPNSKGVRKGDPLPEADDVREVWMAVRWLMDVEDFEPPLDLRREGNNYEGVVDNFLMQKKTTLDYGSMGSALGHRKAVNNENVRAMFGDQPPMTTVDLHEDEVAEILKANGRKKLAALPALMLLKLFLFSK